MCSDNIKMFEDDGFSVLLVVTDFEIGGTPLQVLRLAGSLKANGVSVSVCSLSPPGPITKRFKFHNIPTYSLGARSIKDIHILFKFKGVLSRIKPDIVHSFLVHSNFVSRIGNAMLGKRCKHIGTICTIEREKRWHNAVERITSGLSDKIVCVSEAIKNFAISKMKIKEEKLRVIRPGIDIERILSAQPIDISELGIEPSEHRVCFLGRLDPIKQVDVVIRAIKWIKENSDIGDIQLVVIGDGEERNRLVKLVDKLNIADSVYFLGFREDYERILKICDVYALASKQEGWGIATVEAIAAGLVPVVSNVDGSREIVEFTECGVLVDSFEPIDFAKGIIEALEMKGKKKIDESIMYQLSIKREVEEYIKLYRELTR